MSFLSLFPPVKLTLVLSLATSCIPTNIMLAKTTLFHQPVSFRGWCKPPCKSKSSKTAKSKMKRSQSAIPFWIYLCDCFPNMSLELPYFMTFDGWTKRWKKTFGTWSVNGDFDWFCMVQKYKQITFQSTPLVPKHSVKPKQTKSLLMLIWLKVLHQFGSSAQQKPFNRRYLTAPPLFQDHELTTLIRTR